MPEVNHEMSREFWDPMVTKIEDAQIQAYLYTYKVNRIVNSCPMNISRSRPNLLAYLGKEFGRNKCLVETDRGRFVATWGVARNGKRYIGSEAIQCDRIAPYVHAFQDDKGPAYSCHDPRSY